jgi:hypothetical protein
MAALLISLILLGILLPFLAVSVLKATATVAELPGIPVTQTVFADLVSEVPDPVMLPEGTFTETENSFVMRIDYDDIPRVSNATAVEAASNFMVEVSYLTSENLTLDAERTDVSGFDQTLWRLWFVGDRMEVSICVNALSGKVTRFSPRWHNSSPFQGPPNVNLLSMDELEEKAVQFLKDTNYSLSENARYVGPILGDHYGLLDYDVVSLSFFNVIDEAVVWHNSFYRGPSYSIGPLSLALDPETGEVLDFQYNWIHVSQLPTDEVIESGLAEQVAANHLFDRRNVNIQVLVTALVFERIRSYPISEFYLCWVVYTESSQGLVEVHVDALNASIVTVVENVIAGGGLLTPGSPVSITYVPWVLVVSFLTATISYTILRRKVMRA